MQCGGTVDVHAHVKIHACMGRRVTPSVGRLTVLHEFVVVEGLRCCEIAGCMVR